VAQAREGHTAAPHVVDDYDAICRVLQLCTEGEAKGDVAKLREAFHAEARMFGSISGERYDVPIEELFELAESSPADTGSYRSRVLSVQQTGDAAVGVVAEEGYWGTVSFIDYFLLARINGDWKIVCKLFAHTGGEPPEGL
jgi:Putative lumazine-binding